MMINFFNILLESHFKHFISFIQTKTLNALKVDFSSLKKVDQSSWSCHNNIDFISEFIDLLVNSHSSINRENIILFGMKFKGLNFICNLNAKFSCWKNNQVFDVRILGKFLLSESFEDWEGVCHCLSTSCSVTSNEVLSRVNGLEGVVLDWEEELDSLFIEHLNHVRVFDEVSDMLMVFPFWLRLFLIHERFGWNDISGHHGW